MDELVGTMMVVHVDRYDWLMEGLLNVYFLDSVYYPMNICLKIKSSEFHCMLVTLNYTSISFLKFLVLLAK
jgi:hypothetical protein